MTRIWTWSTRDAARSYSVSTSRRFDPNVQRKRYWLPSEGRHVRLRLSAKGIKTVDAIGVEAAVAYGRSGWPTMHYSSE